MNAQWCRQFSGAKNHRRWSHRSLVCISNASVSVLMRLSSQGPFHTCSGTSDCIAQSSPADWWKCWNVYFFLNTWKTSSPCWLNSESQVLFEYSDIVVVISTVSTNPLMFFNTIFSTNSLSASLYKSLHHWKICNSLKQGYTAQVVIVPLINRASFSPPNMSGLFQLPLPSL